MDFYPNVYNYEYIYLPGYLPIPLNYLYEQYKKGMKNNFEKYQETNSISQISTTSDGEHNLINNNINNNINNLSIQKNKSIKKEKKLSLEESIKKGIKDISDVFNLNPLENCSLTLACYYHCDLNLAAHEEYYLNLEINDVVQKHKKNLKKKEIADNKK